MNSPYLFTETRPIALSAVTFATSRSFTVNCDGFDTLVLQCNYTRSAGTALVFTFTSTGGVNDSANAYTKLKVDYASTTISAPSFTYTTSSSGRFEVPFSLTGIGAVGSGNVTVTIANTSGGASDTITVTPILARTV